MSHLLPPRTAKPICNCFAFSPLGHEHKTEIELRNENIVVCVLSSADLVVEISTSNENLIIIDLGWLFQTLLEIGIPRRVIYKEECSTQTVNIKSR